MDIDEINQFENKAAGEFAIRIACWLASHNFVCAIAQIDDGSITIKYADVTGHEYPMLRVSESKIVWPAGTDLDLMFRFIEGD